MRKLYGLVGKTLGHSFSRVHFTEKFKALGILAAYENFELAEISEVQALVGRHPDLRGFNVTIPYKEAILPLLDDIEETAARVGAVNTVLVDAGKLYGFNTDVIGFRDSLAAFYAAHPGGEALVLGTGGASKAVCFVLEHYFAFDAVKVVSRAPQPGQLNYADLESNGLARYRLIVNTTPVGMYPDIHAELPLQWAELHPGQYLFDLIYNPDRPTFLQRGAAQGCKVHNGMDMLIRQAEAAWEIWQEGEAFERRA
jgi:shikimate dehydrogenase